MTTSRPIFSAPLWDERFSESGFAYGSRPSTWLTAQSNWLKPGMSALLPADGEGRNGVWLARQGLQVHSVDFSRAGLDKAEGLAARSGVSMQTELADLTTWSWPVSRYDLVVAVFFHVDPEFRPALHHAMLHAVRPGGRVLLESFHTDQLGNPSGGPKDVRCLHDLDQLRDDFAPAALLHLERCEAVLDEGRYHQGPAVLVRMLAERALEQPV